MNLTRVTITGADNSTNIREMLGLSSLFPFVEWGILVSKSSEGSYRFPSREWVSRLVAMIGAQHIAHPVALSMHVCGKWVRQMLVGELDWMELPDCVQTAQRVQINTHASPHISTTGLIRSLMQGASVYTGPSKDREFIFQWDGVNNHLALAAYAYNLNISALFDTSGGAGLLPDSWPAASTEFPCGYAGGLSPDNVVAQIGTIEALCPQPYWIDMERRVRTDDDSALDMEKVRKVLELCQPLVANAQRTNTRGLASGTT